MSDNFDANWQNKESDDCGSESGMYIRLCMGMGRWLIASWMCAKHTSIKAKVKKHTNRTCVPIAIGIVCVGVLVCVCIHQNRYTLVCLFVCSTNYRVECLNYFIFYVVLHSIQLHPPFRISHFTISIYIPALIVSFHFVASTLLAFESLFDAGDFQ